MSRSPARSRGALRPARPALALGLGLILMVCVAGDGARAEPPVQSAQDALCRNEARARVFSMPNPRGLPLEAIGRQIYETCMRRAQVSARRGRGGGSRR